MMDKYEVRLEVLVNGSRKIVHTIVVADNIMQARALAHSLAGVGGRILFGPYPVS
jgi:hypothetical protein